MITSLVTVFSIVNLMIAVVLHEIAHGYAALFLGDSTAKEQGRLTLNPLPHIDPIMTVALPALLIIAGSPVVFGGAKPVPVNSFKLRKPKTDMGLIAVAGPLVNFSLVFLYGLCAVLVYFTGLLELLPQLIHYGILFIFLQGLLINLVLGLFNLTPIPPLDGGRILIALLPLSLARMVARIEPYGFLLLIGLLYLGMIDYVLGPLVNVFLPLFATLFFPDGLTAQFLETWEFFNK